MESRSQKMLAMISQPNQVNVTKKLFTEPIKPMDSLNPPDFDGGDSNHITSQAMMKKAGSQKNNSGRMRLDSSSFLELFDNGQWDAFTKALDESYKTVLKEKYENVAPKSSNMDPYVFIDDNACMSAHTSPVKTCKSASNTPVKAKPDFAYFEGSLHSSNSSKPIAYVSPLKAPDFLLTECQMNYLSSESLNNISMESMDFVSQSSVPSLVMENETNESADLGAVGKSTNTSSWEDCLRSEEENEFEKSTNISSQKDCLPTERENEVEKSTEKDTDAADSETLPPAKKKRKKSSKISESVNLPTVTRAKRGKKRAYDKVHHCLFCGVKIHKISRHLELCHKKEPELKDLPACDKTNKDIMRTRETTFELLINEGDFYHNREVLARKEGTLILKRMPTELSVKIHTYNDYRPCPHCLAYILKSSLTPHMKTCVGASEELKEKRMSGGIIEDFVSKSDALLGSVLEFSTDSEFYTSLVSRMKDDDVTALCKGDSLILGLGAFLFEKFGKTQCEYIRQSMRMLGRLLREIQNLNNEITSLVLILNPALFDQLVKAVKNICLHETRDFDRPDIRKASLLLKLGPLLKKTATLHRGICLRKAHEVDASETEKSKARNENRQMKDFLSVMELEWKTRLSSAALLSLRDRKYAGGQLLPVTSDLMKLKNHINEDMVDKINKLKDNVNLQDYRRLSELLLTAGMLFNKKRTGDISNMKVENWTKRKLWADSSQEIKDSMTPLEQALAERMAVCDIIGKSRRHVPVIFTPLMIEALECLLIHRDEVGVDKENPYLFAIANYQRAHLRAHFTLSEICKELPLIAPQSIKGTNLRKYVATVVQVLNLTETEQDWLARHLGHDIRVHREFYRLHENAVEATKVSRLLLAVEDGNLGKMAGKKLNELTLEDLPPLDGDVSSHVAARLTAIAVGDSDISEKDSESSAVPVATSSENAKKSSAVPVATTSENAKKSSAVPITTASQVNEAERQEMEECQEAPIEEPESIEPVEVTKSKKRPPPTKRSNQKAAGKRTAMSDSDESYQESEESGISDLEDIPVKVSQRRKVVKTCHKKQIHTPWSDHEKHAITKFFETKIRNLQPIGLADAERCKTAFRSALRNRDKKSIKTYYFNYLKKLKKSQGKP